MAKSAPIFMLTMLAATSAFAQEAPAPRSMPRTPVSRETLLEPSAQSSRDMQGPAIVIDGEKLRIGKTDLRIFGVVPPQLAASFGPQARSALDAAIGGQNVLCHVRDRDRDGRLLATCLNASGNDLALELLKRGLAVTLRGSIATTELAATYLAAEQNAQAHRLGIWSMAASAPAQQSKAEAAAAEAEAKKEEKARAEQAAAQAKALADAQAKSAAENQAKAQAKIAEEILAAEENAQKGERAATYDGINLIERYQILISGFLMFGTALCIAGALERQRSQERKNERKAIAAALRGELMAARGVCFGRAKSITSDAEDRTVAWPRIRTILYQAYVGRLGMLGAELSRQVASVYGQSSDYAAIYNPTGGSLVEVSKKHALEMLIRRFDEVLPKLAEVERTGKTTTPSASSISRKSANFDILSPLGMKIFSFFRSIHLLWENARSAAHNSRTLMEPPPPLPPEPPHASEYTAIIEADMEQYSYTENVETLTPPHHRRRHKEKGAA